MIGKRLSKDREHRGLLDDLMGAHGKLEGVLILSFGGSTRMRFLRPMFIMHRAVAPMFPGVFVSTRTMLILSRREVLFIVDQLRRGFS